MEVFDYDANGDVKKRTSLGAYAYGDPKHPHGVTAVGADAYGYDATGNQVKRPDGTVEYTSFDLPSVFHLAKGGDVKLEYDAERIRKTSAITETTTIGGLYERVVTIANGVAEHHYRVQSAERTVAVVARSKASTSTRYVHVDNVGSVDKLTDATGKVVESLNLPRLLGRLYTEVANGGFGPGAGLLGVQGGYADADGRSLAASYGVLRTQEWPDGLLPLWDLGCAAWACVDARGDDDRIVVVTEPGPMPTRLIMSSWLEAWLSGADLESEVFEVRDGIIMNPFTKKPMAVKTRGKVKGAQ